jgi:hypothetical protein
MAKITVVTPFQRKENIELMANVLNGKANWIVLIDDHSLAPLFPDWVTVKKMEKPPVRANLSPSNWLFNEFISQGLDPETQYMILNDDDSVEDGFFDKIPDENVVICSMKRGDNVRVNPRFPSPIDLIARPENMKIGYVSGEQCIAKGKILRNFRYGLNFVGDGVMVMRIVEEVKVTYVPNAFVLFNYFEDGRFNSFKRKPLVLFVCDYFCGATPSLGISEWETNLYKSLESTGLANVLTFHLDKYYYHYHKRGDDALLMEIKSRKPDHVVLIIYKQPSSDPSVISLYTIARIRQMGIPVVTIWGDLQSEHQQWLLYSLRPFISKVFGTASKKVVESLGGTYMHVPKDKKIFNNPNKKRDIDVVFSGSYGLGREERREALMYIETNGVKVLVGGSEGKDHFTTEEYADRYKRAKMAISFSTSCGQNVVNARPFEVMSCGSLLIEQKSEELSKLYIPGVDYVEWADKEDLLKKIQYYLEHEDERVAIAMAGQKKTEELYSAKTFWINVLKH